MIKLEIVLSVSTGTQKCFLSMLNCVFLSGIDDSLSAAALEWKPEGHERETMLPSSKNSFG
jgi:hypothetical protein